MTENEQAAAILAAINAAIAPAVAYEYGKVPGTNGNAGSEPTKYVLVAISRRYVPERRASGEVTVPGGRLSTRYIAKSVADGRTMRQRTTDVLEDKILTTAAGEVGPFVFESGDPFQPDETFQVATDLWTF